MHCILICIGGPTPKSHCEPRNIVLPATNGRNGYKYEQYELQKPCKFHTSTIYQGPLATEKVQLSLDINALLLFMRQYTGQKRNEKQEEEEDTMTGCSGEFGQYWRLEQIVTD